MAKASDLFGGSVTNHAGLTGLGADDHPQYLNTARGDARYYSKAAIDTALGGKASTSHGHSLASLTDITLSAIGAGEFLMWDGAKFINRTIAEAGLAAASHAHTWASITGKPSSFTPATHSHGIVDITGLQSALDGKAALAHGHVIANITGLQTALDGKAAAGHSHSKADIGLGNADNTADADKPISTATQAALNAKAASSHGHSISGVTGLQTALDGKAASSHSHTFASLGSKPTTLAGYGITDAASAGHSHAWSAITGKPSSFAPIAHGHPISDVTGLQAALDSKAGFNRVIVSAAHTAALEQVVAVDTSGAAITVTAPADPDANDYFYVADVGANAETNNITVDFGAEDFNGSAQDFLMDVNEFGAGFIYTGTTWRLLR